jgi:hypothetical protein
MRWAAISSAAGVVMRSIVIALLLAGPLLRKLHLVRPDLIQYPLYVEYVC